MITPNLTNDEIKGTLQTEINITGNLNTDTNLMGTIINGEGTHKANYSGTYEFTPQTESQTIDTKNKIMSDDIEINPIPYQEVSNQYGKTVYIG